MMDAYASLLRLFSLVFRPSYPLILFHVSVLSDHFLLCFAAEE